MSLADQNAFEDRMDAYCEAYIQKSAQPLQEKLKYNADIPVYQIPDNLAAALAQSLDPAHAEQLARDIYNLNLNAIRQADTRATNLYTANTKDKERAERQRQFNIQQQNMAAKDQAEAERRAREFEANQANKRDEINLQRQKNDIEMQKLLLSVNQRRLVDQDVKKANDLQPTLMVVNFIRKSDAEKSYPIQTSFVIGVKAKLYVVDGSDIQ